MPAPERHVRHLRLVASSEDAARAVVPRLEDALRCASLPDEGARLLLVRRLALGPVSRQSSSQAIARLIEARFSGEAVVWTEGDRGDLPRAERVVFASAWHARVALSERLLRGERCSAWYWPLAVPEFHPHEDAGGNLRAIARAIARTAEARAALPAWAVRVARRAGVAGLVSVMPPGLGEALVRQARVPWLARVDAADAQGPAPPPRVPDWLRCLLYAGGWRDASVPGAPMGRVRRSAAPPPAAANDVDVDRNVDMDVAVAMAMAAPDASGAEHAAWRNAAAESELVAQPGDAGPGSAVCADARVDDEDRVDEGADMDADFDAEPTMYAGLLFLLPVLERLGLPRWAESSSQDVGDWARAVLAAALWRLGAPAGDPMWTPVSARASLPRVSGPAPASWCSRSLRAPNARHADVSPDLPQAWVSVRNAEAQVELWLAATRRWLRRGAGIGLASLVRRPGRIAITPTHVDLRFALAATDLRVRRAGLDIDPGWLPWFGRVVAYHYRDEPAGPSSSS